MQWEGGKSDPLTMQHPSFDAQTQGDPREKREALKTKLQETVVENWGKNRRHSLQLQTNISIPFINMLKDRFVSYFF